MGPRPKRVMIHGLQRSGTNFVQFLLERNFHVQTTPMRAAGKHGPWCAPDPWERLDAVVVISKPPYAWMVSLFEQVGLNRRYEGGKTFSDFLRRPCSAPLREGPWQAASPAWLYNAAYNNWLAIGRLKWNVAYVRYEDLLDPANIGKELSRLKFELGLSTEEGSEWVYPHSYMGTTGQQREGEEEKQRASVERFQNALSFFGEDDLPFVNTQLERRVMEGLGYEYA